MPKKIACILMAAGDSKRFNGNKLLFNYKGKNIIDIAIDNISDLELYKIVVVSQYDEILKRANKHNFIAIKNNRPEDGISRTIKLGISEILDCDAALFLVSDQPQLKQASIKSLINCYQQNPHSIIGVSSKNKKGNPVIFPFTYFDELSNLTGDNGGKSIINKHLDNYITIDINSKELIDIDTKEDLLKLEGD